MVRFWASLALAAVSLVATINVGWQAWKARTVHADVPVVASPDSLQTDSPRGVVGARFSQWVFREGADAELVTRGDSSRMIFDEIADDLRALGKWTARLPQHRVPSRDVVFVREVQLVDRFGALSIEPVVILRYRREDWLMVQWETIPPASLIHLGRMVMLHPALRDAATAWCLGQASPHRGICAKLASTN